MNSNVWCFPIISPLQRISTSQVSGNDNFTRRYFLRCSIVRYDEQRMNLLSSCLKSFFMPFASSKYLSCNPICDSPISLRLYCFVFWLASSFSGCCSFSFLSTNSDEGDNGLCASNHSISSGTGRSGERWWHKFFMSHLHSSYHGSAHLG